MFSWFSVFDSQNRRVQLLLRFEKGETLAIFFMVPGEIQRRHGTTRKDKSRQKRYREEDFAWHPCAKMTPGQPALTASLSSKTVAGVAALRYDDQGMLVDAAQGHEVRRSNHARRRCTGSFGIRAPQTHTKIDSPKIDIFLGFRTWDPGTQAPGALGTRGRDPGPGPRDPGAQDPGPRDGPRTHRPRDPGPGTQGPGTQGPRGPADPRCTVNSALRRGKLARFCSWFSVF